MTTRDNEPKPFQVEFSDPAQAEADDAYLRLSRQLSPTFALRWYEGLFAEAQRLELFPTAHPLAPESDLFDRPVRQTLYRRGRLVYRLLFLLVDSDGDGEDDKVRILHVRSASRRRLDENTGED